VVFEHAFTSPRVRALDTARLACGELGIEPVVHPPLGGNFADSDAAELIAATSEGSALLLVGHEPDLSGLVSALTAARIEMKKGGLAAIRVGAGRGELSLLLRPREIELVAED
jgi:phosphohistidine phosphatase